MLKNERKYTFKCPECKSIFTYDQPGEPMCTGPGALTQHDMTVMKRTKVIDLRTGRYRNVSDEEGTARSKGTLWLPWNLVSQEAMVNGELWVPKNDDPNWTDHEREMVENLRDSETEEE